MTEFQKAYAEHRFKVHTNNAIRHLADGIMSLFEVEIEMMKYYIQFF